MNKQQLEVLIDQLSKLELTQVKRVLNLVTRIVDNKEQERILPKYRELRSLGLTNTECRVILNISKKQLKYLLKY